MPEHAAKTALRNLSRGVVSAIATSAGSIEAHRGIAFFDPRRDAVIIGQASFNEAGSAVSELPLLADRFGSAEARRVVLQFVYEFLGRLSQPAFDEPSFEDTWSALLRELDEPTWTFRGVANLRYFNTGSAPVELVNGVTIRGRNGDDLMILGFGEQVLDRLAEDWSGFGASSFVIVVEKKVTKRPDNLLTLSDDSLWIIALLSLQALRLLAPGDLSIGRMWIVRPGYFNVGLSGLVSLGYSIPTLGGDYQLTEELARLVLPVFSDLQQLAQAGYARSPGNLGLALRSFMQTYDRWPSASDARLLDSITALEAVLGTNVEIAFKLAFRVAGLLAGSDAERSAMFQLLKGFYDTRSKLVHGGRLKPKHQQYFDRVDELRSFVRRLLRSFIHMAVRGSQNYNEAFFAEHLDAVLVDSSKREALRREFGLA